MDWLNKLIEWAGKSLPICTAAAIGSIAALHWWPIPAPYDWVPRGLALLLGPYVALVCIGRILAYGWESREHASKWWRRREPLNNHERLVLLSLRQVPLTWVNAEEIATVNSEDTAHIVQAYVTLARRGLVIEQHDLESTKLSTRGVLFVNKMGDHWP